MKPLLKTIASACIMIFLSSTSAFTQNNASIIREKRTIVIDGVKETWQLEWSGPTRPACEPESAAWSTCTCTGLAFGESGDLYLVRKRAGQKDERLSLTQFFPYADNFPASGQAVLRRWDVLETDYDNCKLPGFANQVQSRPVAHIMNFADYDHDGRATEFILQTGTLPRGKRMSIVVGISRSNPHLHAFTSSRQTNRPLVLQVQQWEALRTTIGPVKTISWQCGDHSSKEEIEMELNAQNGEIFATQRTYTCPEMMWGTMTGQKNF